MERRAGDRAAILHFHSSQFCLFWPAVEVLKGSAHGESSSTDLHSFQHPRVSQLVQDHIGVKPVWLLQSANNKAAKTPQFLLVYPNSESLCCSLMQLFTNCTGFFYLGAISASVDVEQFKTNCRQTQSSSAEPTHQFKNSSCWVRLNLN